VAVPPGQDHDPPFTLLRGKAVEVQLFALNQVRQGPELLEKDGEVILAGVPKTRDDFDRHGRGSNISEEAHQSGK
jgi:hypothetical protein